ncbi:MAG: TonB-dependent receptor [Bacteroidota bacterium]
MKQPYLYKLLCCLAATLLIQASVLAQGVTTSAINGRVIDDQGEDLIGANVVATHTPTGSVYGGVTDLEGFFRIPNMKVGGPYTIQITYTGYEDFVKENVYLALGQSFRLKVTMQNTAYELESAIVLALQNDVFDGNRTGQESIIDERTINDIPTISRAIGDYARFNPLANISEDDDGFEISLAGQNNRFNAIYIDGAINNDAFGLSGSGTNGGQTGVQPISIDAIEQFQVSVAPFDVRQSGFAGGAINAVTRSGTNEIEGSAYYFLRNQSLAGKTPTDDGDLERERLADFTAQTYGFRLGGPIIKNKLFFFVNAELQRDETPQPFDVNTYRGNADAATIQQVASAVNERFGYDVGTFDNNTASLDSEKFLAKLDYNINRDHKLTLRHSYVKSENLEARNSSTGSINFINGSEFFVSTTNSTALELSSIFGANFSNNLTIGATIVRDDRDPSGSPFPTVFLEDGNNGVFNLGAERFSTANLLNQDIFTLNNNFNWYRGKHNLLFGVNVEYFSAGNLFIRNNFGRYRWFDDDDAGTTGVQQFLAGDPASEFERSFSQVDNVTGDDSDAIAEFSQMQFGLYVQDEFQATDNLKITGGLRVDFPLWLDDQPVNEEFNNTTIPLIEAEGYDLQGARTGSFIGTQLMFSPRVGFNYDINGNKTTQLRGGIGVFTSRIPLVWPGGAFNNYGFNIGEVSAENVPLNPDVNNQIPGEIDPRSPEASGQVDLFADDFKLPQVLKVNLAVDQKLPWGLVGTVEGLFTKVINGVRYQNLNIKQSRRSLDTPNDTRPLFEGTQAAFGDDVIDPTYTYIMLASNTSKGYSYNIAGTLTKNFKNGFNGAVSYSYGDSYTLFDGTSSQNNSQWRGYYNVNGRNLEGDVMRSGFAAGHRLFGQVAYEIDYLDHLKSKFSLNFNLQNGGFYTYVIGARNFNFVDDGGFDNNELLYVPNSLEEIPLVDLEYEGQTYTPEQQWKFLNNFINDDEYLSDLRGEYTERNGARLPMEFTMDFRFLQDFYIKTADGKRNTLQLSLDIFNLTNLINKDWGRRRFAGSFGNYNLIDLDNRTTGSNNTPEYTINTDIIDGLQPWDDNIDDSGFRSSRWQMQVGLRYIFGN